MEELYKEAEKQFDEQDKQQQRPNAKPTAAMAAKSASFNEYNIVCIIKITSLLKIMLHKDLLLYI